jgi:hypothetical protein
MTTANLPMVFSLAETELALSTTANAAGHRHRTNEFAGLDGLNADGEQVGGGSFASPNLNRDTI